MEKKKNNSLGYVIIIILLLVVIGVLIFFGFVDKKENTTTNNNVKTEEKEVGEELSVTDGNVMQLFDMAHGDKSIEMSWKLYKQGKTLISDLDDTYKSYIAASTFKGDVLSFTDTTNMTTSYYVAEEDVKKAYDVVFGEGVYKRMNTISYLCGTLTFDESNSQYSTDSMVCGGMLGKTSDEEIIKAVKFSDRIEITSVVWFIFSDGGICKDSEGNQKIDAVYGGSTATAVKNSRNAFVNNYKDELQQYTYTFKLNENGFYNYYSVERVKN